MTGQCCPILAIVKVLILSGKEVGQGTRVVTERKILRSFAKSLLSFLYTHYTDVSTTSLLTAGNKGK